MESLALPATPKLGEGGSAVEWIDDIIQAVAAVTFTAGGAESSESA